MKMRHTTILYFRRESAETRKRSRWRGSGEALPRSQVGGRIAFGAGSLRVDDNPPRKLGGDDATVFASARLFSSSAIRILCDVQAQILDQYGLDEMIGSVRLLGRGLADQLLCFSVLERGIGHFEA